MRGSCLSGVKASTTRTDTRVHQKQTSKPQSSTATQLRQAGKAFRRENENPVPVGSREGPPALGEGLRRLKAEQARKNASPLCRATPLADTPTKPPRIKPKTRLRERLPSSAPLPHTRRKRQIPLRRRRDPMQRLMDYRACLSASLQSGYSQLLI